MIFLSKTIFELFKFRISTVVSIEAHDTGWIQFSFLDIFCNVSHSLSVTPAPGCWTIHFKSDIMGKYFAFFIKSFEIPMELTSIRDRTINARNEAVIKCLRIIKEIKLILMIAIPVWVVKSKMYVIDKTKNN